MVIAVVVVVLVAMLMGLCLVLRLVMLELAHRQRQSSVDAVDEIRGMERDTIFALFDEARRAALSGHGGSDVIEGQACDIRERRP